MSDIWLQFHAKEQLDDFHYLLGFSSAQNPLYFFGNIIYIPLGIPSCQHCLRH